jgi:AcrR family transcriptional regulator
MPTPAKTSRATLVGIARSLIETGGSDTLTISAVALRAGVKGPSLYKHFSDRSALLKAVEIDVLHELEAVLRRETAGNTARERLFSMARVYRRFANSKPHRYSLIYSGDTADDPDIAAACLFSAKPLFEELERAGIPTERVLTLSRTLVAFLHGFVSMEIAKAFRLGGDLEDAFTAGLETILAGL